MCIGQRNDATEYYVGALLEMGEHLSDLEGRSGEHSVITSQLQHLIQLRDSKTLSAT